MSRLRRDAGRPLPSELHVPAAVRREDRLVAAFAATTAGVLHATITSIFRRSSSVTTSVSLSTRLAAWRDSIVTVWPSKPSSICRRSSSARRSMSSTTLSDRESHSVDSGKRIRTASAPAPRYVRFLPLPAALLIERKHDMLPRCNASGVRPACIRPLPHDSRRGLPRNYPGSCSQREPKRPKATYVRTANLRGGVCGALAPVTI